MKHIYLYIKTHNKTGLKYLGKTVKLNVHKYHGSGTYWLRHLKKHGYNYTTEIVFKSIDPVEFAAVAKRMSIEYDVVNSKAWANLVHEEGAGGDTSMSLNYKEAIAKRDLSGENNPMFNRSAVSEQNLKWYTNGDINVYVTEGTEPHGYYRGRSKLTRSPPSNETKLKISNSLKGKSAPNRIKVNSPTGQVFNSISAAAASLNLTVSQFRHRMVKNGCWVIVR